MPASQPATLDDILDRFHHWWRQAKADAAIRHKGAACVSTVDEHGFPNARFVDLKAATAEGFVFCSVLDSPKATELARCPKAALTLWWESLGYQIRVQGTASCLSRAQATFWWQSRSREAQLATLCSQQSQPLDSCDALRQHRAALRASLEGTDIPLPDNWGAFVIAPISVEFLGFKEDRLHRREHFFLSEDRWSWRLLQP